MNQFLKPALSADFPHYVIRKSILFFLESRLSDFRGTVVDLGCGNMPYKSLILGQPAVQQYIAIDVAGSPYYNNQPDIFWDGNTIPLEDSSVDTILLTEVLEHVDDPAVVLKEVFRVLRKDGRLVGTTPFFWPLHEVPNDMRRFTPFGLQAALANAAFNQIQVVSTGGWRVSLAQFLAAYIGFGVNRKLVKKILIALFYFPIKWLSGHISLFTNFQNKVMLNLLAFTAVK